MKACLLLFFLFALGFASGMGWETYRMLHHFPGSFVEHRIAHLSHELNLTPEQEQALREVFRNADERAQQVNEEVAWDLQDIHHDSVDSIKKILTPQQAKTFDHMHRRSHLHHHLLSEGEHREVAVTVSTPAGPHS
jgi:Spy/CpxP family protein refolding chaperone